MKGIIGAVAPSIGMPLMAGIPPMWGNCTNRCIAEISVEVVPNEVPAVEPTARWFALVGGANCSGFLARLPALSACRLSRGGGGAGSTGGGGWLGSDGGGGFESSGGGGGAAEPLALLSSGGGGGAPDPVKLLRTVRSCMGAFFCSRGGAGGFPAGP